MGVLNISGSPHVHAHESVRSIMVDVCIALLPAVLVSLYFFGLAALKVLVLSVASCVFFEWFIQKYMLKKELSVNDFSAVVTGILLALNVPSSLPWYVIIIGALVSIGIAKMVFGGLGNNIFNPALVGRVFLLVSFPVQMTLWPNSGTVNNCFFNGIPQADIDAMTGPTPLGTMGWNVSEAMKQYSYMDLFMGNDIGGSMGEVSVIALLAGGIFLLVRRVISWHIPVSFILSAFVFSGILFLFDSAKFATPLFHILSGGMMLGAIFMATDMVTSPMTAWGKIVFGTFCGLITILIRCFGAYPEGVSFAILIMNAFVPLINTWFKPTRFGVVKEVRK